MRRDTRRFVYYRWKLIEVPQSIPLNPMRLWRERHGFVPPLGLGAVVGCHFRVEAGVRAVQILRPETLQVPDHVRTRLFAVIEAMHRVGEVRLALSGESPTFGAADRLPRSDDREYVQEWPEEGTQSRDLLVAELTMNTGVYLTSGTGWDNVSGSLDQAIRFSDVDEAENYLAAFGSMPPVLLRHLAAVLAESDQREAAAVEGKQMPF